MQFDIQQRISQPVTQDPLANLLHTLQLDSVFYTRSSLSAPWGVAMPPIENSMMFHLIVEGEVLLEINQQSYHLQAGDFVILPFGQGHIIKDAKNSPAVPLHDLPIKNITPRYETLIYGGGGAQCELICGAVFFTNPLVNKLISLLPVVLQISQNNPQAQQTIQQLIQILGAEAQNIALGGEAIITRLADILVIHAIRQYIDEQQNIGWLKAMKDKRIGRALQLIHQAPDTQWTLISLANEVGMSRTAFSQRFKLLVGETPLHYISQWRMSLAHQRLSMTSDSILEIGLDLGYQSESAFCRAFKKLNGHSPSQVRRQKRIEISNSH
ncbi:AraC family transcriptional regulator [Neptunicella marina]|uniref:AraC family transcriptional regulator n=1 Tax=Neptunicella marina TaxID=2125989 RepID=A0A8J6M326_9ALTE|nr:AraC family transcriptional regulator [Neptunicella marina]MBC3767048.1 AraC family transcriptional regulator [Neptunicella marina]